VWPPAGATDSPRTPATTSISVTPAAPAPPQPAVAPPAPAPAPIAATAAPEAQAPHGPTSGTLECTSGPIPQNAEYVFRNVPAGKLQLDYDTKIWEARLAPVDAQTQKLILKNKSTGYSVDPVRPD